MARFQVSVDEAIVRFALDRGCELMCFLQKRADADRVPGCDSGRNEAILDEIGKGATFHQFHGDEEMAVAVVPVVVDRGHHPVRLLEALLQHRAVTLRRDAILRIVGLGQQDQLERDARAIAQPSRPPDGPEAALVEGLFSFGRVSAYLPRHGAISYRTSDGSAVTMTLPAANCCRSAGDSPFTISAPYPAKRLRFNVVFVAFPIDTGTTGVRPARTNTFPVTRASVPS